MRRINALILITVLFAIGLIAAPDVSAQDSGKPTPIDSYPLPGSPGASRYSLADRWDHTDLTYFFHNCPTSINCNRAYDAVRQAFQAWDDVSALEFTEVNRASDADIEIQWSSREEEFGQPGGVLAFAYFPTYGGDLYFDDSEFWTIGGGDTDLFITAIHEIGHTIGLDHTDDDSAVMFPYLLPLDGLAEDDIQGIQRLYGPDTNSDTNTGTEPEVVTPGTSGDLPTSNTVEVVEGTISNQTYYDVWTIDANAGETVVITAETLSGDLDTYLAVTTPDMDTVLAEDDDSMGGTNSQITVTFPTTDDYVILVSRYGLDGGTTRGDYRLTAYRNTASAPQPTPVPSTANLVVTNYSGTTLCGVWISSSDSEDWGEDWLPSRGVTSLNNGQYLWWEVQTDTYDVLVADCFGNTLDTYLVEVSDDAEVQVYQSSLVVP